MLVRQQGLAQPVRIVFAFALLVSYSGSTLAVLAEEKDKLPPKQVEFFESKIRPVLVDHCYKCHSADAKDGKPKGGLRLDTKEAVLTGGATGPALIPGNASGSLIMDALRHDGLEMPPGKKLPEAVIADFEQWIRQGAPDPRSGGQVAIKRTIDIEQGRKFWAFQPPKKTTSPPLKNATWAKTEIDRFVLAGLESHDLAPAVDADRRTLIRRLYFDLIGLPPTREQVQAFVADVSPTALETVVDQLLESHQFGERWGRHWLDVARYAESNGNADNTVFGHAWRYRDYVIASLNADKPFNRFIIEQVAGDLLPSNSPAEKDERLVATGFLALGSKPRAQNNANFPMDIVAEQIEVTTTGFMGLTVACARCHDHKFDPIPTKEYYSLAGIFSSTHTLYGTGVRGKNQKNEVGGGFHKLTANVDLASAREKHSADLAVARNEHDTLVAQLKTMGGEAPKASTGEDSKQDDNKKKNKKPNNKKNNPEGQKRNAKNKTDESKSQPNLSEELQAKVETLTQQIASAAKKVHDLENNPPSEEIAMGVRDDAKVKDCAICVRGESSERGDVVRRGVISVVTTAAAPTIPANQSGRLQLADWIASPENPLTSRVIVNRLWKHLYGRGIVPTVDNFGELGERPSHPELLDNLTLQFIENGWSIKKMIRTLVLTRTYGLSSDHHANNYERDPDNVYLWRHTPHRLDAESIRDSVLFVTGTLSSSPFHGSGLSKHEGDDLRKSKLDLKQMVESQGEYRSVYLPIVRNSLPEALDLFDAADPSLVTGSRDTTNVPAQSLYLLNSPFMIAQSRLIAKQLLADRGLNDSQRVDNAFRKTLVRDPSSDERARTLDLLAEARKAFAANVRKGQETDAELRVWGTVTQALLASAEFRYVE